MATSEAPREQLAGRLADTNLVAGVLAESTAPIGAANPKAIAEFKLGRTLDPKAADFQETVASALGKPYDQLFDPKFGSVVFSGIARVLAAPALPAAANEVVAAKVSPAVTEARVAPVVTEAKVSSAVIQAIEVERPIWWPIVLSDLSYDVPGEFIVDVPTATSPVQGGLADCWLVSSMASVAWCHPDLISERTLKAGTGVVAAGGADYEFTFYSMDAGDNGKSYVVKDDVPQSGGGYIYARSNVAGETWPANLEKAFIGVIGATGFGEPSSTNYNELNYNWPDHGVAALVGRPPWRENANAADAWTKINSHCTNGRATDPMVAWTFGTGSATVHYDGTSGIVANHAYSILGTETSGGHNYVVLRNPWGNTEATLNVLPGTWQGLTLPGDGVFALRMDTFAQYYAAFGGA
ncbi:MAG TPA: C2 family cysteine protease [Solirubrobacteraceae bacterium]